VKSELTSFLLFRVLQDREDHREGLVILEKRFVILEKRDAQNVVKSITLENFKSLQIHPEAEIIFHVIPLFPSNATKT